MATEEDARQRANDERTKQHPVDRSQKPVADAREQGQRHGMGDVGADETGDRGARVEQNENRHADGPGADRGERQNTPSRSPAKVVSVAVHRGSGSACRVAVSRRSHRCNRTQTAVMTRAMPKAVVISGGESLPLMPKM